MSFPGYSYTFGKRCAMKIAVFPGSFDPMTNAHLNIVERGRALFDKIYVAVGVNHTKKGFFTIDERLAIMQEVFHSYSAIEVVQFSGLTVDFCRNVDAQYILRGMRSTLDFEYEKAIAQNNSLLAPNIETVFLISKGELSHISSTIIREIMVNQGDVSALVPEAVITALGSKL